MLVQNKDINTINIANLAYLGDAVYELEIRNYLIKNRRNKVNILKELSTRYVSAVDQSMIIDNLLNKSILTEDEVSLINRARNYRSKSKPKHVLIKDYKKATSLECLFGYLYLNGNKNRIDELIDIIIDMR